MTLALLSHYLFPIETRDALIEPTVSAELFSVPAAGIPSSSEIIQEVLWVFAFLTAKDDLPACQAMLAKGLCERVLGVFQVYLHESLSEPRFIPLIRIIGNISSGPAEWSTALMSVRLPGLTGSPLIHGLRVLLGADSAHRTVRKECMWVVSNIFGSESDAVRLAAASEGLLECVFKALAGSQYDVQREAVVALNNALASQALVTAVASHEISTHAALGTELIRLLSMGDDQAIVLICRIIRQLIKYNADGGSFSVQYRQLLESQGVLLSLDDIQFSPRGDIARHASSALYDECFPDDEEGNDHLPTVSESTVDVSGSAFISRIGDPLIPTAAQVERSVRPVGRGGRVNVPAWMESGATL